MEGQLVDTLLWKVVKEEGRREGKGVCWVVVAVVDTQGREEGQQNLLAEGVIM